MDHAGYSVGLLFLKAVTLSNMVLINFKSLGKPGLTVISLLKRLLGILYAIIKDWILFWERSEALSQYEALNISFWGTLAESTLFP